MTEPLGQSMCCGAPLKVASGDEGTSFYVCSKCDQPSDPGAGQRRTIAEAEAYVCACSDRLEAIGPVMGRSETSTCDACGEEIAAYEVRVDDPGRGMFHLACYEADAGAYCPCGAPNGNECQGCEW